jgi:hypothetical protein
MALWESRHDDRPSARQRCSSHTDVDVRLGRSVDVDCRPTGIACKPSGNLHPPNPPRIDTCETMSNQQQHVQRLILLILSKLVKFTYNTRDRIGALL